MIFNNRMFNNHSAMTNIIKKYISNDTTNAFPAVSNRNSKRFSGIFPFVLFLIVGFFLFTGMLYLKSFPIVRADWTLATTVKPVNFTELYFRDQSTLPSKVSIQKWYSFTFTIHNMENRTMVYPYTVFIEQNNGAVHILESKKITIENNASASVQVGFILNAPVTQERVTVNLTSLNQQIDFWVTGAEMPISATKPVIKSSGQTRQMSGDNALPSPTPTLTKQYGGWYLSPSQNKAMVWLGINSQGQDIWSNTFPK